MQKSYLVKATLCIEECQFYLRVGDLLTFTPANQRLAVYRNGSIVKVLEQSPLSVAGMLKTGILEDVTEAKSAASVEVTPTPKKSTSSRKQESKKVVAASESKPTAVVTDTTI